VASLFFSIDKNELYDIRLVAKKFKLPDAKPIIQLSNFVEANDNKPDMIILFYL
jgi:hypothetical protein